MTYKETLLFVGKCLTITHEKHNRELVEQLLKTGNVNWDNVVKLSTSHYIFPALYCNLKRTDFLHYLPNDLVAYMQHITALNRTRNSEIIAEAKEINELLLKNNITPIFLKGTGNLLDNLYEDIAERMVGDIDFLVDKKEFKRTVNILKKSGYSQKNEKNIDNTILNRHYPKMTKKKKTAAIEIHYKMVTNNDWFNYNYIYTSIKKLPNTTTVLSFKNQLLLTSFNKQVNDKGQWTKNISFRNSYDLYLLSKLTKVNKILSITKKPEISFFTNFVASTYHFFNQPNSLEYVKTNQSENYVKKQLYFIEHPKKSAFNQKKWELYFLYHHRFSVILKAIYLKEYRTYLLKRLFN
ncbi:nucleotidyltransferase family protein [Tenacibaculum sp. AHE15PA]|uniref:nucleotidyltransferase family protein n=1 Tax=unclassified Tenacibaculum TaxID=2635139 RepID=UPI001C4EB386|nr:MULTISPECIES: nucleotidyltransferase family protein [unclassified Tenacibaculum]QXP72504.1 nucleotidyltransferase family protein [Tenacibaculum sp. AHE14PA]QXP76419.1 nucleotidyltransferase family protein [Tenacibaculum sp. AHE15PA]